jgi:arabinofuranan 3-O-arabinosyltransferase
MGGPGVRVREDAAGAGTEVEPAGTGAGPGTELAPSEVTPSAAEVARPVPAGELPPPAPPRPSGPPGGPPTGWRFTLPQPEPRHLVVAALLAVLAIVVFGNSAGSFATDAKPELYFAPWRSAAAYLSPWQEDPQLGVPNYNVGLAPVAAVVGLIQAVGVSPAGSVRVLRLILLVLGAAGAARLFRALRSGRDRRVDRADVGPLVAGVAFVANPFVVVSGGTQAVLLPWAWLPWQLLCLVAALRQPAGGPWWRRWRWPAAFALTFFAMTGLNAGVIPLFQLLAVPVVALVLRRTDRLPGRRIAGVLARCAALAVVVSAYWLVPSVLALRTGATVVDNSETVDGIAGPSSYAEVLRGLGVWPLYGSDANGPWLPEDGAYLREPLVVALSFGLPVLAALGALVSRGPVRRLGLALVAVAAPIMVSVFPPDSPSPFGRGLRWLFDTVPAAGAFRTTNKIGSLLVLGTSLLVAALAVAALRRTRGRPGVRAAVAVGLVGVLGVGTAPAWTGQLYSSAVDLPDYWRQAAADLNAGAADTRAWFLPGEVLAAYRWSQDRPDDLSTSLLTRPSLVRMGIPVTSPVAANLLTAVDTQLNEGSLPPGALSAAGRYLGVGELLLRNDVVWEDAGGGRPQVMQDQLNADPGLRPLGNYGAPGQNAVSARFPPASAFEAALPPLQRYAVVGARPVARVERVAGTVLVDGDGWAVAPLVAAGLLTGEPSFRYLSDLTPAELGRLLAREVADTGRIVLTDTNRRRTSVAGRLGASQGPLLPASADPGPTRALAGADAQTVLRVEGGQATATDVGSAFGPLAFAAAENAVDGDPRTAWQFGDFGRAVGQSLTVRTDAEVTVPVVRVRVAERTGVQISRVRVTAGGVTQEVEVDPTGVAVAVLDPPVRTDTIQVGVAGTRGVGFNTVGISEVDVPGVRLGRVARLPRTLTRLAGGLDGAGLTALSRTPVDVALTRVRGTGLTDDEEAGLARDFELPVDRTYRAYGLVRPATLNEQDVDTLAGAAPDVTATSTSRAFDLPTLRASQAVDGRPDTAWLPGEPVVGQSIRIEAPARVVDHIDVTQLTPQQSQPADWVTRVRVSIDGRPGVERPLRPGTTRIRFDPIRGRALTLTVLATHSGSPTGLVRLSEVDFGGARMAFDQGRAAAACVPVGRLDGQELRMRPVLPLTGTGPAVWAGCAPVRLAAEAHLVRPGGNWTMDELVLRDRLGDTPARAGGDPPQYQVEESRGPGFTVRVDAATAPYYLVTGQAYDSRWRARLDGRDLGPPITVDGYSSGWLVEAAGSHTITVWYAPQRLTDAALVVSLVSVLGCLVLLLLRAPPVRPAARRRPAPVVLRRRGPVASTAGWLVVVGLAWVFGGLPVAAVAVAVAGWHLARPPRPKLLLLGGTLALVSVPVLWLALRPDVNRPLTARIVQDDRWPHWLAAVGLLLLVLGAARAERAPRRPADPGPPPRPSGPEPAGGEPSAGVAG